ncbi:MAG: shikimate kinase [Flavobacteriaceae bacterium]
MKIVLIGYMGSGKTTIGKHLAKKSYLPFFDLDSYIESKEKLSITDIFDQKGEIYFRKIEHRYLKEFIENNDSYVLSLGGGTPCYAGNMNSIKEQIDIHSFYLQASIPTLKERLVRNTSRRPLLAQLSEEKLTEYIAKHLFERRDFYEEATHRIKIDSKSVEEVVAEIRILLH